MATDMSVTTADRKVVVKFQIGTIWKAVMLGQLLSLLVTGTSFSSSELARSGINAPMAQVFLNYVMLAGVYGSHLLLRKTSLKIGWHMYLLFAFIDVESNYLVTKAYQYTSITSAMLLDCWTLPLVLLLTWLILKTRYFRGHVIGVSLCVLGLVLVVLSDVHDEDRPGGSNALLGDILVLLGATLYGVNNVYEEFLVNKVDRSEILALSGCFGAIISGLQMLVLERGQLKSIQWTPSAILPFVAYAGCLFSFSTFLPLLLQMSGSTWFNLSLLTSDMYAVAIRWILYHESVDWLYFVALATVSLGLALYANSGEISSVDSSCIGTPSNENRYERLGQLSVEPCPEEKTGFEDATI